MLPARFISDSVTKRMADSKAITEKEAQKAELEADLMGAKDQHKTSARGGVTMHRGTRHVLF